MTHAADADFGPLAYFKAQHRAFAETIAAWRHGDDLVGRLLTQACSSFDGNVAVQAEGQPPLACHKGCATCCTIRVTATAPEVLLVARYLRVATGPLKRAGIDLPQRLADADRATRGLDEPARVALRRRCPFIAQGVCVIYPARPLACRGHASHDKRACVDAAAGRAQQVPYSVAHMTVRSLVQNALQSALRDAGYAWAAYELNHAAVIALARHDCEAAWAAGEDVFAAARVDDVAADEMAQVFERIKAMP